MHNITLGKIRKHYEESGFYESYRDLILERLDELSKVKILHLLRLAVIFLNQKDEEVQKLGYRIILCYSNSFKDYIPLYDVALSKGYIPIAAFIEKNMREKGLVDISFFREIFSTYMTNFIFSADEKSYFLSAGQRELFNSFNEDQNSVLIAPTSYGKSEVIISRVAKDIGAKICILVPSKALIAQTKHRLLENKKIISHAKRVITHPEMYNQGIDSTGFVAVLTQERLLRLLQHNQSLTLDLVLVDEAHNILEDGARALLLLQVLMVLLKRNSDTSLFLLTPFIADSNNLKTSYLDTSFKPYAVKEFMKIEKFLGYDARGNKELFIYDQFLDVQFPIATLSLGEIEFIMAHKAPKNIVYLNRPKDIERVALEISKTNFEIKHNQEVKKACEAISSYLHKDYTLLKCIPKGVLYHHGKVPEIVRLYVEDLFRNISELELIVTNSTLLEGVNIPAEKIFLMSVAKGKAFLSKAQFKNLIGRVCRFSDIFGEGGNLEKLSPQIYVIAGAYQRKNFNLSRKIKEYAGSNIKDKVENPLLDYAPNEPEQEAAAVEYVENIEPGTIKNSDIDIRVANSVIGKSSFRNNIRSFDIISQELTLQSNLNSLASSKKATNAHEVIDLINKIFIEKIEHYPRKYEDFLRLKERSARDFYAMFLDWRMQGYSYNQMIRQFMGYWKRLIDNRENTMVFVGQSRGELSKDGFISVRPTHIDISQKSDAEKVNLAIVRIKEEQDFIDYHILPYVEVLNDLDLIESQTYDRIKYATDDQAIISLLREGFSLELAKILKEKYSDFWSYDSLRDAVSIHSELAERMEKNNENNILIFEVRLHSPKI